MTIEAADPDAVRWPDFVVTFDGVPFAGMDRRLIVSGAITYVDLNHGPEVLREYLRSVLACDVPVRGAGR